MDWLREFKLPAAAVIALCAAFVSGYVYLHTNFVSAASFDVYQNQIERRILLEKKQSLEAEILRLDVKRRSLPKQFTAVDAAVLERLTKDLARVQFELDAMQKQVARR